MNVATMLWLHKFVTQLVMAGRPVGGVVGHHHFLKLKKNLCDDDHCAFL